MNIKVQCCGIVIVALLLIIYNRHRRLDLIISRIFHICLYATLVCLVLDVVSIVGIVYQEKIPAFLTEFICRTYIVSLVAVFTLAVVYVANGIALHIPTYKKSILTYTILSLVIIALVYVLPINIHHDAEKGLAWTNGPSAYAAYLGAFVFIIINSVQVFRYREHLYDRQRQIIITWMFLWIAAALIQLVYNQFLAVGFAGALGVMLVFLQFESPELYLDRTTGLFNATAYARYGEQLYSGDREFHVIAVTFENPAWSGMATPSSSLEAREVYDPFLAVRNACVFKTQDGEVLLVFGEEEAAKSSWERMKDKMRVEDAENMPSRPSFYYFADPKCVRSSRELLELLRYVNQQKNRTADGIFHVIDHSAAAQILADYATTQMILDALNEDRVVVYYQPIFSVAEKRFTSAEALVRIIDREGKLIPPGEFIQVAENNGLIIELGKRVFEKVCRFYQEARLDQYGLEYVEVNLSLAQCVSSRLADDYIGIMENARMDPRRVNLEITESSAPNWNRTLVTNMDRMINYGVNFSLDDFGTGASNLNYIVDMPIRIVKFDRGMTQAYFSNGRAKHVMDAAMHMIHGIGLEIVAEGVETEEQYRKMEEIKINFIQGFYFSKPLPELQLLEFLSKKNSVV